MPSPSHPESPKHKIPAMFRALRHRNFALFFMGQGISLIGTWMQQVAMSWLVYRMTKSAFLLGVVAFCAQIPTFLFASFAGVLADRWNRRRILIVAQSLAMAQAVVVALLTLFGVITIWEIVFLSVFLGVVNAVDIPVRQAFVVDMIGEKEDLGNAIALNSALVNAARLIGPSLAGVLIAAVGEGICFGLNAVSYAPVIAAFVLMRVPKQAVGSASADVWKGWKEGLLYSVRFSPIGVILTMVSLVSMSGMAYMVLMPVFATTKFHGGAGTLGFLVAFSGCGALVGTLFLASRKNVLGLGRIVAVAAGLLGFGLIAFAVSPVLWISLAMMFLTGFGMIVQLAGSNTILQTIVEDDKRGRVMSLYAMAFMGMAPFGSLVAGFFAARIGASATVIYAGVLCLAASAVFARRLPELRKTIHPIYVRMGILPGV